MQLLRRTHLLPTFGSIQAWHAIVDGQLSTVVRSRPDIIKSHHANEMYFSNIDALAADLLEIASVPRASGEFAFRRVHHDGDIPSGVFAPVDGWVLRDLAGSMRVERELAAAIALAILRWYTGGPTIVTRDGNLERRSLPPFQHVWDSEMPSFTGLEPELNEGARIDEMCANYIQLGGDPLDVGWPLDGRPARLNAPSNTHDGSELAALTAIAHPDPGPALVRALRLDARER